MSFISKPPSPGDYQRQGFLGPIDVMTPGQARAYRSRIEELERNYVPQPDRRELRQYFRVNGHVVIPMLAEIARTPSIIDAVTTILGRNILTWSVELFIKEAQSDHIVSWHQDLTYWGMGETDGEVTAWIALSHVSIEAGCMRFIPGSHLGPILAHNDTFDPSNLLSRGQELDGIDENKAVHCPPRTRPDVTASWPDISRLQRQSIAGQAHWCGHPVCHAGGPPGLAEPRLCHADQGPGSRAGLDQCSAAHPPI